jgi:hypothetical protein
LKEKGVVAVKEAHKSTHKKTKYIVVVRFHCYCLCLFTEELWSNEGHATVPVLLF